MQLGRPSVAHATAAGKVMLAFTGRPVRPPLAAYTERTITDPRALEEELERIRRRGWADAYEEREPELNAIAAPVSGARRHARRRSSPSRARCRASAARAARTALPSLLEHAGAISRRARLRSS